MNQRAVSALARDDDDAGIAGPERRGLVIETKAALLLLRAGALVAGLAEERLDVVDEADRACRGRRQRRNDRPGRLGVDGRGRAHELDSVGPLRAVVDPRAQQ